MDVESEADNTRDVFIFVYGTLRKGASNHFRLEGASYITESVLSGALYVIDWYPGMVLGNDVKQTVLGEIYKVSVEMLNLLDDYEGAEYQRRAVEVIIEGEQKDLFLWEYSRSTEGKQMIPSGDWLDVSGS